jgi:hypothetical protein
MYKQLLLGGFALALAFSAGLPARSQTSQTEPQQQQQPQPQQQQTAPAADVSSEDLQKFANAVKQIQTIQQDYQGRMAQAVEQQGLSQDRYLAIQESQANPTAKPNSQVSEDEKQKFEQATAQVSQLQQEAESKMKEAVQAEGLDVKRFNEIFAAIQQDPSLQQQVQQMMQK